jgi:hypothetical protein
MDEENKVKQFLREHRAELTLVGLSGVALLIMFLGQYFAYRQGLKEGLDVGVRHGWHGAIKWFTQEFPETKLNALWEQWVIDNPGQLV